MKSKEAAGVVRPQLEICMETLPAGRAALAGGADRVELCAALSVGGLTPSHALIAAAIKDCGLPVHVLIRPRAGGFVYGEEEFRLQLDDVRHCRALGAAGCVVGLLTADAQVDVPRTRALVEEAGGMEVTFHRAFDHSRDLNEALEQVIEAGCRRVLTSGGQPSVSAGRDRLAELVRLAAGRLRIAAGGGVTLESAPRLVEIAGLDLHASLRRKQPPQSAAQTDPLWQAAERCEVDPADVRALGALLREGR